MKKIWVLILTGIFCFQGFAQRNCGQQAMFRHLETVYPGALKQIELKRTEAFSQLGTFSSMPSATAKTTSTVLIPVVFHFVVDSNQFKSLGGIAGIENRIKTQMLVINEDFNGRNEDQVKIPVVWKPLFANTGVSFGLASVAPGGGYTLGYDVKIVSTGTSYLADDGAKAAKFSTSGGLDAWDNTKYLNIWIVNLKTSGQTALGITAPPGFPIFTKPELGISLNYLAFGTRTSPSQQFIKNFDRGRTLTHELGHYFYLWHTWGDDGGLCPDNGGKDDGFSDTPPEADATTGSPTFPRFDVCSPKGDGVMFMNYMDYSDDSALYMFTLQQAAMVKSQLSAGGYSYSLTLNPNLSDSQFKPSVEIRIYPNPTEGKLNLSYDNSVNQLQKVIVFNMLGQKVIETTEQGIDAIDMSALGKGLYFVHCYFEKEIVKRKIILQ